MISIDNKDLLFYDIEVFSFDSFVVFKDIDKNVVGVFRNDFDGIWDIIKDKTLIGFNNYFYDDKILSQMLRGFTPEQLKKTNDKVINENYKVPIDKRLKTLDVFQQISVSKSGLKKIEGNMGKKILESSVPFDIDRPLTEKEYQEAYEYCCYDVDMVVEIWKLRKKSYFEPKLALLERYGNPKAMKWNTTTISANMLLEKPLTQWSTHRVPEELMEIVPPEVKDNWNKVNDIGYPNIKIPKTTVKQLGMDIVFSSGGIHGAKKGKFEDVILMDVDSQYPSTITNLSILGKGKELYESLRTERVGVKLEAKGLDEDNPRKDELSVLSDSLKLVLNSVYGQTKSHYSKLYNPRASVTICFYCQALLYELGKRLSSVADVIQLNTDGAMFKCDNESWKDICEDWEKEFNFGLSGETFKTLYQKDVNNYIAVRQNGKLICKGGDVSRYYYDKFFDNNSIRIVDIAIVDYVVNGIDVIDTLRNNLDKPELYQYILQAGGTFDGTFEVELDNNGNYKEIKQHQKINRVFATKGDGILLTKKKTDKKTGKIGYNRFPDTPTKMYLWNDECEKLENFKEIVDLNWYYKLIQDKLESWV